MMKDKKEKVQDRTRCCLFKAKKNLKNIKVTAMTHGKN